MATIYINGAPYEAEEGQSLLKVCLSLGFDVPYFCWHPALNSVGACRLCAVKQFRDEKDTRGFIIMSCVSGVCDGMRISVNDPEVLQFRASVLEWLMLHHPHDCPVCDEGGECHLQDMAVMTGHAYRRYRGKKRTYRNQFLGPFIHHEMNRCIQCYRCVRFYREYAGGRDFNVFGIHNRLYFGRSQEGTLENEFSGNLVEVCPTGVFTDKTFRKHFTRKWDLQTAPSICVHCGLGCNTIPGERYDSLRRILNRYNGEVNRYFLCDRGRFGYEFVNSDSRVREPVVLPYARGGTNTAPLDVDGRLKTILGGPGRVIGIGSPRASLESNFLLLTLVGQENFFSGLSATDQDLVSAIVDILRNGPARTPTLYEVESCDAVLVLGEDLTNTAPRLALALRRSARNQPITAKAVPLRIPEWHEMAIRQAIQDETGPLFIATSAATKLDDIATRTIHGAPEEIGRLGFAIAHELSADAPAVDDLPADLRFAAQSIARHLQEAQKPLVISGPSSGSLSAIQAAANIAWALVRAGKDARLCYTVPECNSVAVALLHGKPLPEALGEMAAGRVDAAIILENDLFRRADAKTVQAALENTRVVVIDQVMHATADRAEVVLPGGTFAESSGTLVNNEARAQRFYQVFVPKGDVQESWRWLLDLFALLGRPESTRFCTYDDVVAALAGSEPLWKPVSEIAPAATFRMTGQKVPRQPHRYSGRTAMLANLSVHEPKPVDDPNSALAFSMEGHPGIPPAPLIPRYWAPGWNSAQALNKFQSEVAGPLLGGDPGRRLIEPLATSAAAYFDDIPAAFQPRDDAVLVVPGFDIFGSDELSALSPAIAARIRLPWLALTPEDAERWQLAQGDEVHLEIRGEARPYRVRIVPSLALGLAQVGVGLPGTVFQDLPAWGKVYKPRN